MELHAGRLDPNALNYINYKMEECMTLYTYICLYCKVYMRRSYDANTIVQCVS